MQDQLIAQENQRRMAGRIETLEMEISRISRELDALRSDLDRRLATIEQKSEADKRELIARLSGELDNLVKQVAATPAPTGGSAYGYEHIVRPGETLSTIAKAYNVTTQAIIQANRIKNPDRLSVGQKLFIPE
jgi:LysM repeat protein